MGDKEEVRQQLVINDKYFKHHPKMWKDWQPEQGKLYDIPKGYSYKFEQECNKPNCRYIEIAEGYTKNYECLKSEHKEFAILIPQQEVKPDFVKMFNESKIFKREVGFYWVQEFGENNSAGIWSIAHWEIGSWFLTGCADTFQDEHFYKIGEHLTRR